MRHAMANRRRNRQNNNNSGGHNSRPQHNKATVFDSNGPDVRIRGTAFQIVEKYMGLAKDANASGDRVLAENYLQHAEHYQRLIGSWAEENPRPFNNNGQQQNNNYGNEQPTDDVDAADAPQPDVVVTRPTAVQPQQNDDDLGLPASILGDAPARPVRVAAAAG